jgi:hypothetical protein
MRREISRIEVRYSFFGITGRLVLYLEYMRNYGQLDVIAVLTANVKLYELL